MQLRTVAILLSFIGGAEAATAIRSIEPSATQAVVRATTDQPGPCTYRAAEDPAFTTLIYDVDPGLFPGGNQDTREGSTVQGSRHTMVLGRRDSEVASDGKRYSRALRAYTAHWVGITCGADPEVVATFQTANPPLGQSFPEPAPFDPNGFGNYAWPSIDFTNQSKTYIDPMTGLTLKRISGPSFSGIMAQNNAFTLSNDVNSAWTSAANVLTWPGNPVNLAAYSGAASDPLFVAIDLGRLGGVMNGQVYGSGWTPGNVVDDIMVRTFGSGSDAAPANRNVLVCLSLDSGNTCKTKEQTITLPNSTPVTTAWLSGIAGSTGNQTNYLGEQFTTGASPISVTALGRWCLTANSGSHTIYLSLGSGSTLASATITCPHNAPDRFIYASATATLAASTQYYIVSSEVGGGDDFLYTSPLQTPIARLTSNTYSSSPNSSFNSDGGLYTRSTPSFQYTTQGGSSVGPTAPASTFPTPAWTDWATPTPFAGRDFGNVTTNVTTSGTTITNTGTGSANYFDQRWATGCKVLVNGAETYTISSVVNSSTITTTNAMTTHATPVTFTSYCAGVRIRKQTGVGSINLSVGYDLAASFESEMSLDGTRNICNPHTVTVSVDANDNPISPSRAARICSVTVNGNAASAIFAFFPDNGETRLLSALQSIQTFGYHSPDWNIYDGQVPARDKMNSSSVWDATDATSWYTQMLMGFCPNAAGLSCHPVLVKATYTGDFSTYNPWPSTNGYYLGGYWPDDKVQFNVVGGWPSANRAVDQQTTAFGNPNFNASLWNQWNFKGVIAGGFAAWQAQIAGENENPTFFVLQDISTGNVTRVVDTISQYPLRFWCNHGSQANGGLVFGANICGNPQASSKPDPNRFLGGPFILNSVQVQHSGVMSADTSLTADYADTCPTNIDPLWQALGATGSNCVLMQAQQPCSSYASAAEAASYPCPWDSSKSMVSTLAPGDRFWLERNSANPTSGGPETMRVVTTPTPTGVPGVVQFWALRRSENYGNLGGSYGGTGLYSHATGWSAMMIPPEARTNANVSIDSAGNIYPGSFLASSTHGAAGAGLTAGNYTAAGAGYDFVNQVALPDSWGITWNHAGGKPNQFPPLPDYNIGVYGQFGGIDKGGAATETYASMQQNQAPSNERRWFLDLHHLNPSNGAGFELFSSVGTIAASPVAGTNNVYLFANFPGDASSPKVNPPMAYAGPYLLKDISGPSSLMTDFTSWSFCFVYVAGECRPSSTVGTAYTSVPQVDGAGMAANSCIANWYAQLNPCVLIPHPSAGWAMQYDASRPQSDDNYWRKLTQGFSGMGRQYQFGNITPVPDGGWAFMQCYWCDGVRNDIFAVQLPPFPGYDSINRADYFPFSVRIPGGVGLTAIARFGYAENGPAKAFYCMSRQEACVTDPVIKPFAFAQSDSLTPVNCINGCTITIPAVSGRVLYYRIERLDASGKPVSLGRLETAVIP